MAGDMGMAGKVTLLLWAQTLVLAGAQTTQLLVEPPWTPAVWWDRVTLTCQGSGTAGDTTWYKDGQRWGQNRRDHLTVTVHGNYTCDRPGSGRSPPVTVSNGEGGLGVSSLAPVGPRGLWVGSTPWVNPWCDQRPSPAHGDIPEHPSVGESAFWNWGPLVLWV
ncbi:Fc receptor-like protein 3 [Sylvia borin]